MRRLRAALALKNASTDSLCIVQYTIAVVVSRRAVKEEGLWIGHSSGAGISAVYQLRDELKPSDIVVVICHDHGSRYMGKIFSDEWMHAKGFLKNKNSETVFVPVKK